MSARIRSIGNRELLSEAIRAEINSWPEVDRQVFMYAHYAGKSRREIADTLGLSLVQVCRILQERENELRMALRSFREEILRDHDPDSCPISDTLIPQFLP